MEGVEDDAVYVAVGKDVKQGKLLLDWTMQNFGKKKICLLHVHQPEQHELENAKLLTNKLEEEATKAVWELGMQRMIELINGYLGHLLEEGVEADNVWIEMDSIERGIIQLVVKYNIRWLVMGAASEIYNPENLKELKSKKAKFVSKHAPSSCHIWFPWKGCLIYIREGENEDDQIGREIDQLLLQDCQELGSILSEHSSSIHAVKFSAAEVDNYDHDLASNVKGIDSQLSLPSPIQRHRQSEALKLSQLLTYQEEESRGQEADEVNDKLQQALVDARNLKREAFEESVQLWRAEEDIMEAVCKAKSFKSLCSKEMRRRKELEDMLARENRELERMKNLYDKSVKELHILQERMPLLETRLTESNSDVKELEAKFFSAVDLLVSFKDQRDKMYVEHRNAVREVAELKETVNNSLYTSENFTFTFSEITEATHDFDPAWKIGEGRNGSVYHGLLRHLHVAIKMLPSYGSQGSLEFQRKVISLSRIRHPNLVMLLGSCPETKSLIYEYQENGSLEDCLACKGKAPPMSWKTRVRIASEICGTLAFLHSSKPPIVHGKLKPSKVLLGASFVSKISDLGVSNLILEGENDSKTNSFPNISIKDAVSAYADPEVLENGKLTPESDVYSFGVMLLRLITGRPASGVVKDVKCALDRGAFETVLDTSLGDWPHEESKQLAYLALRCCEESRFDRPDLVTEVWSQLESFRIASTSLEESDGNSKESRRAPSHFVCPIFQDVMKDPRIAADGFTYEAEAIEGWFKSGHNTSPMTNLKLDNCDLIPNHALHYAILEWLQIGDSCVH